MIHGLLRIDKPAGPTSAGVLEEIKRNWAQKNNLSKRDLPKIGHAGTLDPFATGLLLVFVGNAARLSEYFLKSSKSYTATVLFGVETASGDLTLPILNQKPCEKFSLDELQRSASDFTLKEYWQEPPMYSAVKINGKRLYELARQGVTVERKSILKKIENFQILSVDSEKVTFTVKVESGTYIRSLAQDWARSLGTIGALESLRRTSTGWFDLKGVPAFSDWIEQNSDFSTLKQSIFFTPLEGILKRSENIELPVNLLGSFLNGNVEVLRKIENELQEVIKKTANRFVPVYCQGRFLGTIHHENNQFSFGKIFNT